METSLEGKSYDVIVAGGGLAGVLAAARLATAGGPERRIVLLEKEPILGGRLRSSTMRAGGTSYGYGLNAVSERLFEFLDQTLKADPEALGLEECVGARHQRFGVLASNKINLAPVQEWLTPKGARILGGFAAKRQWDQVVNILGIKDEDEGEDDADERPEQPFSHFWKLPRKAPAAVVLEHYAHVFGVSDLWSASPEALAARGGFFAGAPRCGDFSKAIDAILNLEAVKRQVTIETDCWIVHGDREGEEWVVDAKSGTFRAPTLVVAQPPWQAIGWLARKHWPADLLALTSKTKPVSIVVLTDRIVKAPETLELPDVTIVPSEQVQILHNKDDELVFQATIDFELSLQAPVVVKAVKRLRRARRKLLQAFPDLELEGDFVALMPFAWTLSPAQRDKRYIRKLAKPFNAPDLVFCGDSYGCSYDADENLVKSVLGAVEALSSPRA